MFALGTLDPAVQGILFLAAVILFVIAALGRGRTFDLVAAGLALFVAVFAWNALAAA